MPEAEALRAALAQVVDPEVGLDIVSLGLVYRLECVPDRVELDLTLTSPACPMGEMIAEDAEAALRACLPASTELVLNLVWEPPWTPELVSPAARAALGW
ncbi:metal-sulfur cluster assembly factor [Niveibacterium sp. SC-1]|uniref:metal-sulfur cluster assembly factor n=1 Tax=Niveibacterium sp. SC-1 TaxID=3135646 RepID=UPI00311E96EB